MRFAGNGWLESLMCTVCLLTGVEGQAPHDNAEVPRVCFVAQELNTVHHPSNTPRMPIAITMTPCDNAHRLCADAFLSQPQSWCHAAKTIHSSAIIYNASMSYYRSPPNFLNCFFWLQRK